MLFSILPFQQSSLNKNKQVYFFVGIPVYLLLASSNSISYHFSRKTFHVSILKILSSTTKNESALDSRYGLRLPAVTDVRNNRYVSAYE